MKNKYEIGVEVEEEKDKITGSVKGSVTREKVTLSGRISHDFNRKRSSVDVGLREESVGEVGIVYDESKDEDKIEIYYRPSRFVKALGYAIPLIFGLFVSENILKVLPEPYKTPATVTGGLFSTWVARKFLGHIYNTGVKNLKKQLNSIIS